MSHLNKITIEQSLLALGIASAEYLKCVQDTGHARADYIEARDSYIQSTFEELPWAVWLEDEGFQNATSDLYKKYQSAKRNEYNAKRRLDTKFRQYNNAVRLGGV